MTKPHITMHQGDIPADLAFGSAVAVDTETMGLKPSRDPLCLVQLSAGDGSAHLVQLNRETYDAPNLAALLARPDCLKIFHYARFDLSAIAQHLKVVAEPVYCTKIASRLARTYTDRHGLKDICRDMLGVEISKQKQESDWGAEHISKAQRLYAAGDVLHLHALKEKLDAILTREKRMALAQSCFAFLPARAQMDRAGWEEMDIFAH